MQLDITEEGLALLDDLLYAIKDAAHGKLSPYAVQMLEQMSEEAKASGDYPKAADGAWQQLRAVLGIVDQFSDEDEEREIIEKYGGKLLYYYPTDDHFTMMKIEQLSDGSYRATAYIDRDAAADHLTAYASNMQKHLRNWMKQQNLVEAPRDSFSDVSENMFATYTTAEQAANHTLAVLNTPEQITIGK